MANIENIMESGCNLNHLNDSDEYYLHSIHYKEFTKFPIQTREVDNDEAGLIVDEMMADNMTDDFEVNKAFELAADISYISISNN
jgi:hypothetical protein